MTTGFLRYASIVSSLDATTAIDGALDATVELGCTGALVLTRKSEAERAVEARYVAARDVRKVVAAIDELEPDARDHLEFAVGTTITGCAVPLPHLSPGCALAGIVRGEDVFPAELCPGLLEVGTVLDIALANAQQYAAMEEAAARDSLTGLYNWRFFHEELARAADASERYGHPLALAVLDVDDFKRVNTTFGQLDGDALLAEIAFHLAASARVPDIVGRIGGDEFAVILPHSTADDAARLYSRVSHQIVSSPRGATVGVSLSGGIAQRRPREDADRFFRRAERSLRHAKATGKAHFEQT